MHGGMHGGVGGHNVGAPINTKDPFYFENFAAPLVACDLFCVSGALVIAAFSASAPVDLRPHSNGTKEHEQNCLHHDASPCSRMKRRPGESRAK